MCMLQLGGMGQMAPLTNQGIPYIERATNTQQIINPTCLAVSSMPNNSPQTTVGQGLPNQPLMTSNYNTTTLANTQTSHHPQYYTPQYTQQQNMITNPSLQAPSNISQGFQKVQLITHPPDVNQTTGIANKLGP